jgi:nitrogen fixation NifU-like protein
MNHEALQDLYQEVILDHSKHPRGRGRLEQATCQAQGHNPLCGDAITLFIQVADGAIADISFEANGCAISVASASLMSEMLRGKSIAAAQEIFDNFHAMLTEGRPANEALGELQALAGVRQFPIRIKCATLAWHALKDALNKADCKPTCC